MFKHPNHCKYLLAEDSYDWKKHTLSVLRTISSSLAVLARKISSGDSSPPEWGYPRIDVLGDNTALADSQPTKAVSGRLSQCQEGEGMQVIRVRQQHCGLWGRTDSGDSA